MTVSIAEAILEGAQVLRRGGVVEARREAGSLLTLLLHKDRAFLITHPEVALSPAELAAFRDWTIRRANGEPLQYITGHQEFFGLDFEVNRDVLIPRPETELLVETALALIDDRNAAPLICDVGTGSGCILISLLHERQRARGLAVDISPAALQVALRNAARHGVGERITFVVADAFTTFSKGAASFDLIVANPPYIGERDFSDLQREVREHEPRLALTSGNDGLTMIRRLLSEAPAFLVEGGYLLLEIGYDQLPAIEYTIEARIWTVSAVHNDLQGIPRTLALQKAGSAEDKMADLVTGQYRER